MKENSAMRTDLLNISVRDVKGTSKPLPMDEGRLKRARRFS